MGRLGTGVIFVLVLLLSHSHGYIIGSPEAALNGAAAKVMRAGVPAGSADRRKRYEMNERGFAGDSFTGGFGDFYTMKRSNSRSDMIEKKLDYIIDALSNREE